MKAARYHGIRDIRVEEVPNPAPAPGECLIRVKAVSLCGSDLHVFAEGSIGGISWGRPFIPGHEFSGIVEEGTHFPKGTMVVADPAIPCGWCDMCRRGWEHLCRHIEFAAMPDLEGALAEWVAFPERSLFAAPEGMDFAEAALLEPLAVAVHAVELAPPPPGARVVVLGAGGIGLCVMQVARAAGAGSILVTDLVPERLELARRLGADRTARADQEDVKAVVEDWSRGLGADVVYEAAGAADTPALAAEITRPKGTVALIGIPVEDQTTFRISAVRRNEITVIWVRRQNCNYPEAISLAERGLVDLKSLVTHRFPLAQAQQAFELAEGKRDGALRVVVEP